MSITNWASNKRDKVKENKQNIRNMYPQGRVSSWIASRNATNGDERLLSAQAIEKAIRTGEKHHTPTTPVPSNTTSNQQSFVINRLASAIEAEMPAITFDYFAMHDQCWTFMERLKEAFDPIISEKPANSGQLRNRICRSWWVSSSLRRQGGRTLKRGVCHRRNCGRLLRRR
jgi:hypothetical protein